MKKPIRITCLLLVLAMTLGVLAACKKEENELTGHMMFKGEIVHIAKAPNRISDQYPNSYIIYLKTEYLATEELAEILVTENTEIYDDEYWGNALAQRHVGDQIIVHTYNFSSDIDPMHPRLYVAGMLSLDYEKVPDSSVPETT